MRRSARNIFLGGRRIVVSLTAVALGTLAPGSASRLAAQETDPEPPALASAADAAAIIQAETVAELQDRLQAFAAENASLREQLENGRRSLAAWGDNAAEANAEAELFRRQYDGLRLRMEALGLTTVGEGRDPLEQRLLKSVRDLDLVRQQKEVLADQLLALAETVLRYLKTTPGEGDPETRLSVEAALRATNEALGKPVKVATEVDAVPASLRSGLVLGCKEELALLVANFGSSQGVKVGMPLTVARGDTYIGRARVVQVRERIAGAVIEETAPKVGKIKVGDQLRVDAFY